ncbi:hypothetical protein KL86DYS2_12846 [uncultured Dysgonomonas sp.]|uniref:Uncharacterized protein n=1 Tax=uncultured Dysgonomonas sp. TaxID=206096 RepID=A0A212K248_9BACT|nr:hypothetical protein KL86DYS2_12846 [uncultured Dysgonomonas sp.]
MKHWLYKVYFVALYYLSRSLIYAKVMRVKEVRSFLNRYL